NEKSFQTFDKMILDLAVRGKLVPQIEDEEPASKLLQRIKEEKERLVSEKVIKKEKPLPAITEDEKPFNIPNSWEWVKLGKVSDILSGKGFESSNFSNKNGVPAIKITNIGVGKFIETSDYLPINYLEKYSEYIVVKNDILIALTRPYIKDGLKICTYQSKFKKALLNQRVALIRTSTLLNSEYIFIFMRTDYILEKFKYKFERQSLQPNLKNKDIIDLYIPLPPLEEQERIVEKVEKLQDLSKKFKEIYNSNEKTRANLKKAILEEVEKSDTNSELLISLEKLFGNFEKVIKTKEDVKDIRSLVLSLAVRGKLVPQIEDEEPASELLQKIKEEKERLISEKVIKKEKPLLPITEDEKPFNIPSSWEWVYFSDVLDVRDGTHDTPKYQTSGIPLVTSKNIYNGTLNFENLKYISYEDHLKISNRSKVELNDILFAMIGSIGNPVIVDTNNEFSIKNVALFKYYIKKSIDTKYLWYYLKHVQDNMILNASGGVQKFVSLGYLRKYIFSLPPLEEQQRIVKRVDELMAVCDTLESKIETGEKINQKLLSSLLK
ncbi:MAG: restriction endonuclease subunit S, partial [Fusobacteriaceae bacterium]